MKALIVDDEKMIRIGIRKIIPWSMLDVTNVFVASSGREALEVLEKEEIDLMITDIQMAEMTGIQLIEACRERNAQIRIIVLTGYDEFDYARDCLRMQVQDFLLKPVDEEILIGIVRKQLQSIKEESHQRRITGISDQLGMETLMRKLVKNEDVKEVIQMLQKKYDFSLCGAMQIVVWLPSIYRDGIRSGESESLSRLTIKNLMMGNLDAQKKGITFEDSKERLVSILLEGEKSDELEANMEMIQKLIQEECDVKMRGVIGSSVKQLEDIYISYNEAIYVLEKEKDSYENLIVHRTSRTQLDVFREVYGELKYHLISNIGKTENVIRVFDTFSKATESYNITDQYVRRCCFEMASAVYFEYVIASGEQVECKLSALFSALISGSRKDAYEITRNFIEQLVSVEEEQAHALICEIKRYINEHITEDITVSKIAGHFYLSPNYFSRLFKRITKEGCSEYIVRKRIKKAKDLLDTTNMKIGRIASEVGYRDTNYFSLAFKKQVHMSPGHYREKSREKDRDFKEKESFFQRKG